MSTWLITGCSTGLGRALAEAVIGAGHNAVVSARNVAKVADLADIAPDRVLAVALDVTDPQQVASAAQQAEDRFGGMGTNGAQHTPESVDGMLKAVGGAYSFEDGKVYNLDADAIIEDHSDICHDEVAFALLKAVAVA